MDTPTTLLYLKYGKALTKVSTEVGIVLLAQAIRHSETKGRGGGGGGVGGIVAYECFCRAITDLIFYQGPDEGECVMFFLLFFIYESSHNFIKWFAVRNYNNQSQRSVRSLFSDSYSSPRVYELFYIP